MQSASFHKLNAPFYFSCLSIVSQPRTPQSELRTQNLEPELRTQN